MHKFLVVYGEGGHAAQMSRLLNTLEIEDSEIISIVDSGELNTIGEQIIVPPIRNKHANNFYQIMVNVFINSKLFFMVFVKNKIKLTISTGPGICILPSIICRILGKKVIFIETWSRFETKSFTGRVMYHISTHFYVQNKSLLRLYPKATYSGRL